MVLQQHQRGALDVAHVHPAALALELGEAGDELARQARHALLVLPGDVLLAGGAHGLDFVLRLGG